MNGLASESFQLKFTNTGIGGAGNAWENPANWSCSSVPDANTDLVINFGTIVINSSTNIMSIVLATGVNLTVGTGLVLPVLH